LPELDDLWTTSYGKTLLVKIGLVLVALSWGGMHHMIVRPRLERGDRVHGVGASLLAESSVAIVVLLAAAVLVNGAPPPVEGLDGALVSDRARRDLRRRGLPRPASLPAPDRRRPRGAHARCRAA